MISVIDKIGCPIDRRVRYDSKHFKTTISLYHFKGNGVKIRTYDPPKVGLVPRSSVIYCFHIIVHKLFFEIFVQSADEVD